jgi:hypothetical protein
MRAMAKFAVAEWLAGWRINASEASSLQVNSDDANKQSEFLNRGSIQFSY